MEKNKKKKKKEKFSQPEVNEFFEASRVAGNSFLEEQLKNAKTESEKKRIRRLLKDFS